MYNAKAYSAASATSPLASTTIARRDPAEHDVQIEILFCGICHSDLHSVRNEWSEFMPTNYPIVPGHEIVGRVTKTGSAVTKFKPGDLAAVGCLVDSDRNCPRCKAGLENFCPNLILTFNSPDTHLGGVTYGGYSDTIVVDEHFVLRVPPSAQVKKSEVGFSLMAISSIDNGIFVQMSFSRIAGNTLQFSLSLLMGIILVGGFKLLTQTATGGAEVHVLDQSDAVIANAIVQIKGAQSGNIARTLTTNGSGVAAATFLQQACMTSAPPLPDSTHWSTAGWGYTSARR
jgi:hypothetical protein